MRFATGPVGSCSPVFPHHSLPAHRWTDICVPTFQGSRLCPRPFCCAFWSSRVRLSPGSLPASGIVDLESVSIFMLFGHPQSFLMRAHQLSSSSVFEALCSSTLLSMLGTARLGDFCWYDECENLPYCFTCFFPINVAGDHLSSVYWSFLFYELSV